MNHYISPQSRDGLEIQSLHILLSITNLLHQVLRHQSDNPYSLLYYLDVFPTPFPLKSLYLLLLTGLIVSSELQF